MAEINSEQDLIDGLNIIMSRDFEDYDKQRRVFEAYDMIVQFDSFLRDESIKDSLKAVPLTKNEFYAMRNEFRVLLDWGVKNPQRIVIDICVKYGIEIPPDPVEPDPIFP